jgi:hypothetical protein
MNHSIAPSLEEELLASRSRTYEFELNQDTAQSIKSIGKSMRDNMFQLCLIAYGIRRKSLRKARKGERGGNAQKEVYKDEFNKWFASNDLQTVYGKVTNFTKYAMAGRLLTWVRWQINPDKGLEYLDRLPHSISTLYALQSIIWTNGDKATDEGRRNFKDLIRKPVSDGTTNNTWINRSLTADDVKKKLSELENSPAVVTKKPKDYDPHKINLLRVKAHEGLYAFNRRGNKRKVKGPDIDKVRELVTAINNLIADFGLEDFSVEDNLEHITEKYEQNKNPNFAKGID